MVLIILLKKFLKVLIKIIFYNLSSWLFMDKRELIEELRKGGFSEKILRGFENVRREDFVSEDLKKYAYENRALGLVRGATISQPYTIAFMLELLELGEGLRIVEIGSGSGYVLSLINEMCLNCEIYGIEIVKELVESSKNALKGYENIKVIYGNGVDFVKDKKFDRILVSASSDNLIKELLDSLNEGGVLVCVIKDSIFQFKKVNGSVVEKKFPGFVFVKLVD